MTAWWGSRWVSFRQNGWDGDGNVMKNATLLKTGATGTCVTAICCFTPVLVIAVGAVGLSAVVGYLDYVLFPALAAFVGITAYALIKGRRGRDGA